MTPKLREQAAQLCSAYASEAALKFPYPDVESVPDSLGFPYRADAIACAALNATSHWTTELAWADAECLLRTGWVPS